MDAYAQLSSVWGCFAERGAMTATGGRAVIWLQIFCYPWSSACHLFGSWPLSLCICGRFLRCLAFSLRKLPHIQRDKGQEPNK